MALNVFIRGLSGRGFRVKNSAGVHKVVRDRDQAGLVNGIQVDVDDDGSSSDSRVNTPRILSREADNYIRCADATTTTIIVRGLHRTGFRVKNSGGAWVRVRRGVSATVDVANAETRRILRRNKRDWIRMPASGTTVQIRGLEAGAHQTPRGVGFAVRDVSIRASLDSVFAGANNNIRVTAKPGGVDGNLISITYLNPGGTLARSITVSGTTITVSLAVTGGAIDGTETANSLAAAINASSTASQLVSAASSEGTGAGVVTALANAFLTGGAEQTLTNVRAGASVGVNPDDPETANMLRRHHKKWIEVDA